MECHADGATSICGACKSVYYCSKGCQRKHWKQHKKACKYLKDYKETNVDFEFESGCEFNTFAEDERRKFNTFADIKRVCIHMVQQINKNYQSTVMDAETVNFSSFGHSGKEIVNYVVIWDDNSHSDEGLIVLFGRGRPTRNYPIGLTADGKNDFCLLEMNEGQVFQSELKMQYERHLADLGITMPWKREQNN